MKINLHFGKQNEVISKMKEAVIDKGFCCTFTRCGLDEDDAETFTLIFVQVHPGKLQGISFKTCNRFSDEFTYEGISFFDYLDLVSNGIDYCYTSFTVHKTLDILLDVEPQKITT